MISKELLSKVLGQVYIDATMSIKDENKHFAIGIKNCILLGDKGFNHWNDSINIYELAHKCKEWALEQGYLIGLNARQGVTLIDIETNRVLRYISFDNLEQVIRFELNLCQWILDNKKEGN